MKTFWFLLCFAAVIFADFPFSGKSFVIFEGGNKNSFSLLEDVAPKRAIYVNFISPDAANIYWANLEGMYFSNTLDIATEISRQFGENQLFGASRGDLYKSNLVFWDWVENDEMGAKWSCKDALVDRMSGLKADFYSSYTMVGKIDGEEKNITKSTQFLNSETAVFDAPPECWLQRKGAFSFAAYKSENRSYTGDFQSVSSCVEGWCSLSAKLMKDAYTQQIKTYNNEVFDSLECLQNPSNCTSRLVYDDEEAKKIKTPTGVYIIHLFPQVLWRPRNVLSGGIHGGIDAVSTEQMRYERKNAIEKGTDDPAISGWRSPVIDEKLSTLISFQSRPQDVLPNGDLLLEDQSPAKNWTHRPALAISVTGKPTQLSAFNIAEMLLRSFSYGKSRFTFLSNVSGNCGYDWANVERNISRTIYGDGPVEEERVNASVPYCYDSPADEAKAMTDGREKERLAKDRGLCVLFSGTPLRNKVKRWKLQVNPVTGKAYDLSNYIWKGCPDGPSEFWIGGVDNGKSWIRYLNRNEILDEIGKPYERCRPITVANACRVYDYIYNYTINYPALDWSGQIQRFADKRRKAACPDVRILKRQLNEIWVNAPQRYPTTCAPDPFKWTSATNPNPWDPTIEMEAP